MENRPNLSIPVLAYWYCMFGFGDLILSRPAIFGLTLSAFHSQQMRQYFPWHLSFCLSPIIRKVCCRWAFACCPQPLCGFAISCLAFYSGYAEWGNAPHGRLMVPSFFYPNSLSSSRKNVRGISLSPFSGLLPFNSKGTFPREFFLETSRPQWGHLDHCPGLIWCRIFSVGGLR